ncbi:hypothetical protein PybrP1_006164 [[Pythium] brassicae (nom. inval.)]|nr:hypothetical protein PybrP1_006164 [[Pythium] brassicae (nom. inval.)]
MAMMSRSVASTAEGDWSWLLFVRQMQADSYTLAAVVHAGDARAFFELQLDAHRLRDHIDELGVEVDVAAFAELFKTTLANRASVDVAVEKSAVNSPRSARVVLTYTFGASVSRKGSFELPLVTHDVPTQLVQLLTDLHAAPNEPTLSESQKHARDAATRAATAKPLSSSLSLPVHSASQSQDATDPMRTEGADAGAASSTNPQVLKRRLVPSGTVYVQ